MFYPDTAMLSKAFKMKKDCCISSVLITVIDKYYTYTGSAVRHGSDRASPVLEYDTELALYFAATFIRVLILRN